MDIRLRPLRQDEFARFLASQRREYARSLAEEARMPPGAAEEKARSDYASLFPDETQQPRQRILILEDVNSGEAVGHVFWAPRQAPGTTTERAYLYDLFVAERFRGRGLGRRALELVESDARSEGLPGIDLNVWGGNDVARGLYRSAGYYERAVFMSKELE